jgi:hypothetical protein
MENKIDTAKQQLTAAAQNPLAIVQSRTGAPPNAITTASLDLSVQTILDLGAQRVECARSLVDLLTQAEAEILKEIRLTESALAESRKLATAPLVREPPFAAPPAASGLSDNEHYCVCRGVVLDAMVQCEYPSCPFQWFHPECVGLSQMPAANEYWICPYCTALIRSSDRMAEGARAAETPE